METKQPKRKEAGRYVCPGFEQAKVWAESLDNRKYAELWQAICQRLIELGRQDLTDAPLDHGLGQGMLVNIYHRRLLYHGK